MNELINYSNYLDRLIASASTDIITNSGVEHASILMGKLFENTDGDILMFSHSLRNGLTMLPAYSLKFRSYIANGGHLQLLLEEDGKDSEMLTFLKENAKNGNKNIQLKIIKSEAKEQLFKNLKTDHCHFAVFDNKMFRLEYEPNKYKAFASFNYPLMANLLAEQFRMAFANAVAAA